MAFNFRLKCERGVPGTPSIVNSDSSCALMLKSPTMIMTFSGWWACVTKATNSSTCLSWTLSRSSSDGMPPPASKCVLYTSSFPRGRPRSISARSTPLFVHAPKSRQRLPRSLKTCFLVREIKSMLMVNSPLVATTKPPELSGPRAKCASPFRVRDAEISRRSSSENTSQSAAISYSFAITLPISRARAFRAGMAPRRIRPSGKAEIRVCAPLSRAAPRMGYLQGRD